MCLGYDVDDSISRARRQTTSPPPNHPPAANTTASGTNLTSSFGPPPDSTMAQYAPPLRQRGSGSEAGTPSTPEHFVPPPPPRPTLDTSMVEPRRQASLAHAQLALHPQPPLAFQPLMPTQPFLAPQTWYPHQPSFAPQPWFHPHQLLAPHPFATLVAPVSLGPSHQPFLPATGLVPFPTHAPSFWAQDPSFSTPACSCLQVPGHFPLPTHAWHPWQPGGPALDAYAPPLPDACGQNPVVGQHGQSAPAVPEAQVAYDPQPGYDAPSAYAGQPVFAPGLGAAEKHAPPAIQSVDGLATDQQVPFSTQHLDALATQPSGVSWDYSLAVDAVQPYALDFTQPHAPEIPPIALVGAEEPGFAHSHVPDLAQVQGFGPELGQPFGPEAVQPVHHPGFVQPPQTESSLPFSTDVVQPYQTEPFHLPVLSQPASQALDPSRPLPPDVFEAYDHFSGARPSAWSLAAPVPPVPLDQVPQPRPDQVFHPATDSFPHDARPHPPPSTCNQVASPFAIADPPSIATSSLEQIIAPHASPPRHPDPPGRFTDVTAAVEELVASREGRVETTDESTALPVESVPSMTETEIWTMAVPGTFSANVELKHPRPRRWSTRVPLALETRDVGAGVGDGEGEGEGACSAAVVEAGPKQTDELEASVDEAAMQVPVPVAVSVGGVEGQELGDGEEMVF